MRDAKGEGARLKARRVSPVAAVLGVVLGVVIALLVIRFLPRARGEEPIGDVLPEDKGTLDLVLFQYVPRLEPLVEGAYRAFLGTLDPKTQLVAVIPEGGDAGEDGTSPAPPGRGPHEGAGDRLAAFLKRIDPTGSLAARTRVVAARGPISVWSKDRALVLAPPRDGPQRTTLLIPVKPDPKWVERANDWATLAALAAQMPDHFYVKDLSIAFDAGDFAVTGDTVIIDANLYVKNRPHGVESAEKMKELAGKILGKKILMLGAADGDVPRHHLSMYMTPIGDGTVLVGDPSAALPIVGDYTPGELSPDTGEPLKADFSDATIARFERAAKDLAAAGFRVLRIPTVAFDDKTYFAYTNGVYETRGGKKVAWVPQYAGVDDPKIEALDALGRKAYEDLGWEVRPVPVRPAYPYHGTIGCLANVLARSDFR